MATTVTNNNGYPKVVLLDNENNPFTPLVDITSIYSNVSTKDDAGVLVGPLDETELTSDDIVATSASLVNKETQEDLYFVLDVKIENRQIQITKMKASTLFETFFDEYNWNDLISADDNVWETENGVKLQARKY